MYINCTRTAGYQLFIIAKRDTNASGTADDFPQIFNIAANFSNPEVFV
jgi:hypothetical protein